MKLLKAKKVQEPEYIAVTPGNKKYVIRNPFSDELKINGHKQDIKIFEDEEGFTFLEFKNKKYLAEITDKSQNKYTVLLNGLSYSFTIESPISYRRRKYLEKHKEINKLEVVSAPMPGKIVELLVELVGHAAFRFLRLDPEFIYKPAELALDLFHIDCLSAL